MKYHINGGPVAGGPLTFVHAEEGDDVLEFIKKLLRKAFEEAEPVGGPIRWAEHQRQEQMSDTEAQGLIEIIDLGSKLGYKVDLLVHRQRHLDIHTQEYLCDCSSDYPLLALNEALYRRKRRQSSEQLLKSLGAKPWKKRIDSSEQANLQRPKANFN